jgi:hypothetical protein
MNVGGLVAFIAVLVLAIVSTIDVAIEKRERRRERWS